MIEFMKRNHLYLALPFPPSVNAMYIPIGRGRQILSKRAVEYLDLFKRLLDEQGHPGTCPGFLEARIWICPPDRRRRDVDNILKALFDAMEAAEVYENDSQIKRVEVVMDHWPFPDGAVVVRLDEVPFHNYEDRHNAHLLTRLQNARSALGIPNKKDIPRPPPPENPWIAMTDEERKAWKQIGYRKKHKAKIAKKSKK